MAVTEFELLSGPQPCPSEPALHTAIVVISNSNSNGNSNSNINSNSNSNLY